MTAAKVAAMATMRTYAPVAFWDEPGSAASPRGWLMRDGTCTGFYLDYGPDCYRPGHVTDVGAGKAVSFCEPGRLCRDCQPGNVLAVRYPHGPGTSSTSRYCVTPAEARQFVERG